LEERWYRENEIENGQRQFVVADPDGYLLRFFTDLGQRSAQRRSVDTGRRTVPFELELVIDNLPAGFDALRAEALAEGFRQMERLATDWDARITVFDRESEALLAARLKGALAGIGGLTIDPVVPDALRMRRFYVRPAFRRSGVGRQLVTALSARAPADQLITVNAAPASVPFWTSIGFTPDAHNGHTHILDRARRR
jgi:GNAT superfamily N-acetyltransferase